MMRNNKNTISILRQPIVKTAYALFVSVFLFCSLNQMAGSGTEGGNTDVVTGIILHESQAPAGNTVVRLIPEAYNPVIDGQLSGSFVDTTDSQGCYRFTVKDTGTYNIEAVNIFQQTRLLVTGIPVNSDSVFVPPATLKLPGTIKIFLPDTIDTSNGYVFIKGTTIYKNLSEGMPQSREISVIIDSVPEETIPGLFYDSFNDPLEPVRITDTLTVVSNDTTTSEAFVFWAHYTKENSGLLDNEINDLVLSPDGQIWFATNNGVVVFDGADWIHYTADNSGLPSDTIIEISGSGNSWWFATIEGVAFFDGVQWTAYDTANSNLPNNYCVTVAVDKNNNCWCGMYDGIAMYNGSQWIAFDSSNSSLPSYMIEGVAVDSGNNIWFATQDGIAQYDHITWKVYDTTNSSITSNHVLNVDVDRNNTKWFCYDYGVSRYDGSTWTGFDANASAALNDRVIEIYTDSKNSVWFGSQSGLVKYNGSIWIDYMDERYALLENKWVVAIGIDDEKNVWIGTFENGVIAFGPTIE